MELTQRLECTQELSQINNDKIFPDQIGFLGICGNKHPLKKGPNKIGRDPDTCSVILDVNSISRQHAVINILNKNEFMLMDLDSANKTKLSGKTLQPYMPSPLKNGDMVQFGQVFGVFRLFEEDNDLPMTQAINVPETPVQSRCVSKLNIQVTTIPESPDFSDKDDSFIGASQQKHTKNMFKNPKDNFLKTSGKTIEIKPIGTNKIDNVYWTSSKKSESFTSQANISNNLDDSAIPQNIHELQTQLPYDDKDNSNISIYNALTQVGEEKSLALHEMETQLPADLPEVCTIDVQQNIQFDFSISENKENENIIINSEKDLSSETKCLNTKSTNTDKESNLLNSNNSKEELDVSNDIILFDEIDSPPLEDNLESQSLMGPDVIANIEHQFTSENNVKEPEKEENNDDNIISKVNRRQSGDSTDCEDDIFIAMTQKLKTVTNDDDDDVTDCEDEPEPIGKSNEKERATDENLTDCEEEPENIERRNEITENVKFEDMCTQVIEETPLNNEDNVEAITSKMPTALDDLPTQIIEEDKMDFRLIADLQTQVIEVEGDSQKNVCYEEALTQNIYSEDIVDFKIPGPSPLKRNRKIVPNVKKQLSNVVKKSKTDCENEKKDSDNEDIYNAATQELCIDLCSQKELSPEALTENIYSEEITDFKMPGPSPLKRKRIPSIEKQLSNIVQECKIESENKKKESDSDEIYYAATQELFIDLCSQRELSPEIVKQPTITLNTNKKLSLKSPKENKVNHHAGQESDEDCDIDEKINSFVANLSKSQIMDVIGTEKNMTTVQKKSNDCSDLKVPLKSKEENMTNNTTLNNESHKIEIKTKKSLPNKSKAKKYSDQNLRISNNNETNQKRKEKSSSDIRSYLNKKNEVELLPSRSSSRIRKPTSRMKDGDEDSQKLCNSIFKPIIVIDDDETNKDAESNNTTLPKEEKKETNMDSDNKKRKAGKDKAKDESTKEKITKSEHKPRRSRRTKEKDEVQKGFGEGELEVNKDKNCDVGKSRNTRNKTKKLEKDLKNSKSPSNDKQKSDKKNRTQSKERERKSPEKEIRRSKRHRASKKSEGSSSESKLHKMSNGHEQSTVYNMSSESGIDSPNKLKRSGNFEYPSAKKTKTVTSVRSTPARKIKTHYVLFTAFPCEEVKSKLEKLGAIIVSEVSKCTVVLTMQIKRTFKLLCAVGLGRPVAGPAWVQACADAGLILDPWQYLIKDEVTEKRFQFNLERSLLGKRNFLSGYNISSTPSVLPNAEEMKLIVECSGGKWKEQGPLWVCVSSAADRALWPALKKKGATIVSTEFILGGVLKQKLEIDKNRLI